MKEKEKTNKKSKNLVNKIFTLFGNIGLVYSILSGVSKLNTWDDVLIIIQKFSIELYQIGIMIGKVIHIICLPWNHLTKYLFSFIPMKIPENLQDSIIIASFLIFIPIQSLANTLINKPIFNKWNYFKINMYPLFKKNLKENDFKSIYSSIDSESRKFDFYKILIYLVGPPMEYIVMLSQDNASLESLEIKQKETIDYLDKVTNYFEENKKRISRFWIKKRKRGVVLLCFILVLIIDKLIYVEGFQVFRFLKYLVILSIVLPLSITFLSSLYGWTLMIILRFTKNPKKRAKLYDLIGSGIPFLTDLIKKIKIKDKLPENWLKIANNKITEGEAILLFFPSERKYLVNAQGNKKNTENLGTEHNNV